MRGKNIVTIGGGTGSFVLLSGLKKYPVNISAIVSMADDGGSTGILRDELGVLPPGDVRQCLIALSDSSKELRELMNYRFESGGLKGHSFGNIFLSALEKIKGKFSKGVGEISKILNVKGKVIPVTNDNAHLHIKLKNGKILKGQKELDGNKELGDIGISNVYFDKKIKANPMAIKNIKEADYIVIGPGDFYGSIAPNLLVKGISGAISNSKAKVIFNCNITNKKGQTDGYCLDDYVEKINDHLGKNKIRFVTFNSRKPDRDLIRRYEKKEGKNMLVKSNRGEASKIIYRIIEADLLNKYKIEKKKNDSISISRSFIRHDSDKLAKVLMKIINN
jgi:uncharacterized cofD-like protein